MNGNANIISGHNEPTFTENFGIDLNLPISEREFRSLLEVRGIQFRMIDASNKNEALPVPRHRHNMDSLELKKMYEIYGGVDSDRHIGRRFRAYVDTNGMVVYIENAFSYTGP